VKKEQMPSSALWMARSIAQGALAEVAAILAKP
jgi:hypothetical protein